MPTLPLTAAIIGCGVIAPTLAKALALDRRVALKWACDVDLVKAAATGAPRTSADYREVLNDAELDLVLVAVPHHLHADIGCAVLAANKHLICEKPLATTPVDIARMLSAAHKSRRMASGIFQHRFSPLMRRLRELLAGGDFGPLRSAHLEFRCKRTVDYYRSADWRGRWDAEGGGVLINQAIHSIDLVNWFCGEPISVSASVERRLLGDAIEVEDWAQARITYRGGAIATFDIANDLVHDWRTLITVDCAGGSFSLGDAYGLTAIDHPSAALVAELRACDRIRDDIIELPGKDCYGDHHAMQIADCVSAAISGRRPFVTLADAAMSPQVVFGMYHSSANGGTEIPLPVVNYRRPPLQARQQAPEE